MTEYNYDDENQFSPIFILVLTLIPTLWTTWSVLRPSKDLENTAPRPRSDHQEQDAERIEILKKKQKRRERKVKRMIFTAVGWAIIFWMGYLILVTQRIMPKLWDPYEVLGISRSADEKTIKSHYRKLSLTQHPDKVTIDPALNQTLESVNEHWVEITKAFKALTDDEVRNNYLQYGNPDGKQSFSMGIALPSFIISDGHGKYTIAFYLGLLGVFLPWLVGRWWYGTQKVTKDGVLVNSAGNLFRCAILLQRKEIQSLPPYREYKDDHTPGAVITALSVGDEFQTILGSGKAETGLAGIEKRILADGEAAPFASGMTALDKQQLLEISEGTRRKALALIWAYLGRIDLEDVTLNDEKYEVAPTAHLLNECLTIIALAFGNLKPLLSTYQVSQCLIQAIAPGESPLRQLPYFSSEVVRAVEGEWSRTHMTVQQFMALPAETRRKRISNVLSTAELRSAELIASQLPCLVVERAFFKVHGEKYVTPGSLVQFVIKARFIPPGTKNVPPVSEKDLEEPDKSSKQKSEEEANQKRIAPPLAYAPFFARDHNARWHVFLADTKQAKIAVPPFTFSTFDKPIFTEDGKPTFDVQTLNMTFGAPPQPGRYTFTMHLVCDSYLGLDTKQQVTMIVEDASKAEAIEDDGEISEPDEGMLPQVWNLLEFILTHFA